MSMIENMESWIGHHKQLSETKTAKADTGTALLRLFGPHLLLWAETALLYNMNETAGITAGVVAGLLALNGILKQD